MPKELAIVLNSGGLCSLVATTLAAQRYRPILLHVEATAQVGPRTRAAYDQQVAHFNPHREHTPTMGYLEGLGRADMNTAQMVDPREGKNVAPLMLEMVPLIALAARFAAHHGATTIYTGLSVGAGGDELAQAGEFLQIWNEMLQISCGLGELEVVAPLLELELWQVVDVGYQVSAPFEKTWSCSEQLAEPCGSCLKCRARDAAFLQAVKPDPLRPPNKS